jgi:hypothetical protein
MRGRSCAVALSYRAVESLVVSTQEQPLASRDVVQAHRELHQYPVQHLEGVQDIPAVAAAADHSAAPFTLPAFTLLSHTAPVIGSALPEPASNLPPSQLLLADSTEKRKFK